MAGPYVFDTNSVRVLGNYYPERFPTFWKEFENASQTGLVISTREVYNELEALGNTPAWLWNWVQARRQLFPMPTSEEQAFVREIFDVAHFRALVGATQRLQGHPVADPFVIAAARVGGGSVVTEETFKPNAAKVPNVCQHFGIPYGTVEDFLRQNNWTF